MPPVPGHADNKEQDKKIEAKTNQGESEVNQNVNSHTHQGNGGTNL